MLKQIDGIVFNHIVEMVLIHHAILSSVPTYNNMKEVKE
jgi:hypothetical protein